MVVWVLVLYHDVVMVNFMMIGAVVEASVLFIKICKRINFFRVDS